MNPTVHSFTGKTQLLVIIVFSLLIGSNIRAQVTQRDSIINKYLSEINSDSISSYIQSLQDFGTRYAIADNKDQIVGWIAGKFEEFGCEVEIDSFETIYLKGRDSVLMIMKNVVATLPGSDPNANIVLCAHHDACIISYTEDPMIISPGADDNASGVAAILEIARVLKNFNSSANIKFIALDIEELYSIPNGSRYFAQKAVDSGMNIRLVINYDMIGYNAQTEADSFFVGVHHFKMEDKKYSDFSSLVTTIYTRLKERDNLMGFNPPPGDGMFISEYNFPVIEYMEDQLNPFYHSSKELLENLDIEYCTDVVKASCAALLAFIDMPDTQVKNFTVHDGGSGHSLVLTWSTDNSFTADGYKIYLGRTDYDYDTTYTTSDTTFVINNLLEDSLYYVRVAPFYSSGYEGFLGVGKGIPHSLPLAPANLSDEPIMHQVKLSWNRNHEYDLAGYNLYRSESMDGQQSLLNSSPLPDSEYVDNTALNGIYYYYTIKAVDKDQKESILNQVIRSRVVSLDQGILIVDETADGNGTVMNPTDEQTDEFYNSLLPDFNNKNYDINSEGGIKLADLGSFSTILWQNTDYSFSGKIKEDIIKYLNYGGNLLFTGYYPSKVFSESVTYPKDFVEGEFVYDYLKIMRSDIKFGSRFRGGTGEDGYLNIFVDSLKTKPDLGYHINYVEGLKAAPGASEIYFYDTQYDTSTFFGSMKGMPVGVEYLGNDFKVVTFSFPLYYMKTDQAKQLVNFIMLNKFNEVTDAEKELDENIIPTEYSLFQNYPNPFNPETIIRYQIPQKGLVTLKIFDILGKEIASLINETKNPGRYEVNFNASSLSSGVYVYQVKVNDFISSKKMILLK